MMTALFSKSCAKHALLITAASLVLTACETVPDRAPPPVTGPTGPVVERPDRPDPVRPTPSGSENPDQPERPDDTTQTVERPDGVEPTDRPVRQGISPAHLAGQDVNRLALLLPFSSQNPRLRQEAGSMMRAAELALFERTEDDTVLIVLDTQGTESGARSAAKSAIESGADVILGPVLAGEVKTVSREARRKDVPVIAFSTDQSVAGRGTYLLSFPPEAEVARVVDYVATTGVTNYAILRPENAYGNLVAGAYDSAVARVGGQLTAAESYKGSDITAMQGPAQALANYHREASVRGGRQAFEAILLPEGGTALRSLAPLLPYYNSNTNNVQFLGTALWMREDTAREPALRGGLFAGPDQSTRDAFEGAYARAFGSEPSRLASLAHDAVDVGVVIADGDPALRRQRAEDYRGFYGADGFVRFYPDGRPDRGLAVYEITGGSFRIVDPAPTGPAGIN